MGEKRERSRLEEEQERFAKFRRMKENGREWKTVL